MSTKTYNVGGFVFTDEKLAKDAENEFEGVKFMMKKINMKNINSAVSAYKMMNEKSVFKTPVGFSYLYSLREQLINAGVEDLPEVNVFITAASDEKQSKAKSKGKKKTVLSEEESVFKHRFINMIIVNVVLIILLIAFAIIANNSENLNIINYQNRIDKQYKEIDESLSEWSRELTKKEKIINDKANELGIIFEEGKKNE